ncbi:MAG: type VI secretion system Vgr family protein [Desulfovibrio sp.]|jgi:type VI secretion system secreted protein VgrG|nr:type VI secretion system Vgr family protein [Desulfovibrio sp.]
MAFSWKFSGSSASGKPLPDFRVLAFTGRDDICLGYVFDALVLTGKLLADAAQTLQTDLIGARRLTLTGKRDSGESMARHGIAEEVSWLFSTDGSSLFRVLLRPSSFRLRLSSHSRIFLNMALPRLFDKLLLNENLTAGSDFENNLGSGYATRPLTCQYNETSFNFLTRHLERVGGYSYIRQTDDGDALVLADGDTSATALPVRDSLDWNEQKLDEVVFSFARAKAAGPTKVILRDHSPELSGALTSADVFETRHARGGGEVNCYGLHNIFGEMNSEGFTSQDAQYQTKKMASARLRALVSAANQVRGESTVPWLQAGYAFTLNGERFQLLNVRHACNLAGSAEEEKLLRRAAGLGFEAGDFEEGYRNSFICHPLDIGPFAPECSAARPVVPGIVHAKVDAAGSGDYAELDKHGRYKVKFFFPEKIIAADAEVSQDGRWSIPLRMMQSHAGPNSAGIHFPLLKGVEVLVVFTDGDPDRPIILGALPNPAHPSVVVDANQQENKIQTPGGHSISLTDTETKKEISLKTPGGHSIAMRDEIGKREIRLDSPCGGSYLRIREP